MGFFDALNHLFNFMLPAAALAVLTTLAAHVIWRKRRGSQSLWAKTAINFIAVFAVSLIGLALLERDGKMLTHAAMVVVAATVQWWQMRR